ncbi:MAG: hypothetical protein PHI68_04900, partial [Candidatus Cloacimonetes bacterium]|nr:hypothetical protein [Candidatus Cloacimonadota bacterium]
QKIARLFGSVRVSADTLSITSDSLVYYRIPEVMNAGGSVVITEKKPDGSLRWFKSDYGTYNRKTEQITVWDKVRSFDLAENAWGESNYGFWDRKDGYAYLTGEPRLQTGKTDTLFIKAEKMEFFHKERKLIATFNVEVRTRDYTTTSDFLIYFLKEDKAVFTGKPVFKSDFATANAEEFYLYLSERKLTSAELKDSCQVYFAEEKNAPQTNWVKADFVKISFENDIIRRFIGEAQVSYFYLQPKGEEKDYLENEATGEYFEAIFKPDSKLDSIKMKQNILGKYKFHNNS